MRYFFVSVIILILLSAVVATADSVFEKKSGESERIQAMIVPHHTLVAPLIDDMFRRSVETIQPKRVIIVGPNHPDIGYKAITGLNDWTTPAGVLSADTQVIGTLVTKQLAVVDEETIRQEHSITTIIPYIQTYFPEATIVPIILSSTHDEHQSRALGAYLGSILEDKTLLVASIDFSHYLPHEIAEQKDKETYAAIEAHDIARIAGLNGDYLDSAPSLVTLLTAVDRESKAPHKLVTHTNSSVVMGAPLQETTSYFTIFFYRR